MVAQLPKHRPDLFWLVLLLIALALMSSCSRNFYCRHCPADKIVDSVFVKETDSVVVHDTIIKFKSDTAIIHDSVPCGDFKRVFHSGRATIKVIVKDSAMDAVCICDAIEARLRTYEYWHRKISEHYHSEKTVVTSKKKDSVFCHFWFWLSLLGNAFFIFTGIIRRLGFKMAFSIRLPFFTLVKRSG